MRASINHDPCADHSLGCGGGTGAACRGRRRAGVAGQAAEAGDAFSAGRFRGRDRTPDRKSAQRPAWPAGGDRQPPRRGRAGRQRIRREAAARRLHAAAHHRRLSGAGRDAQALPFDPLVDVAMVSMLTSYPFVISVRPDSPFRTLAELIAYAKANPGKLNYPSSGIGTVHHLSGELLNAMAGIEMVHVPFRGGASPLTEVLGGRVDLLLEAMTLSIGQIQSGKLRALAVTSRERWKALPDVPTVAETVRGYEVNSFIGLGATGRTPEPIIERANAEVRKALANPETHKRFVELGGEPGASTPAEMRTYIEREIAKWKDVMAARKIEQQ